MILDLLVVLPCGITKTKYRFDWGRTRKANRLLKVIKKGQIVFSLRDFLSLSNILDYTKDKQNCEHNFRKIAKIRCYENSGFELMAWLIRVMHWYRRDNGLESRSSMTIISLFFRKCDDIMVSAYNTPWPGTLCCVFGQVTLLSQCLSLPRCINGYRRI